MKTPIIIEFNGLPGAGKTSIAKALQQKLEERGMRTLFQYNRHRLYRNNRTLVFAPSYWKMIRVASSYAGSLPRRSHFLLVLSIIKYVRMYRYFMVDRPADYLIVDQGLIQAIISLAHCDVLPKTDKLTNLLELMHLNEIPLLIVNCNVSNETANSRITSRPFNGCRVEKMSEQERLYALVTQSGNLSFLRGAINVVYPLVDVVDINTEESVEGAIQRIFSWITQLEKEKNAF